MATNKDEARFRDLHDRYQARILAYCLRRAPGSDAADAAAENEIVNQRRGITPSTALRLSRYFGTSSGFWMNGQIRWDLYQTQQTEGDEVRRIRRHPRAVSRREASA